MASTKAVPAFVFRGLWSASKILARIAAKEAVWASTKMKWGSGRARSLNVIVNNQTQYQLQFEGTHFESGRQGGHNGSQFGNVEAMDQKTSLVESTSGGIMTGVSGGACWSINYEHSDGTRKRMTFVLGFTHPFVGKGKTGVILVDGMSKSGNDYSKDAYNKSIGQSDSARFKTSGQTEEGKLADVEFQINSSVGTDGDKGHCVFTITETVYER